MHKRMKTFGCGAVGVLAWLFASSAGAQLQPTNHFKVYDVDNIDVDVPVELVDQFRPSGTPYTVTVDFLDFFANPAVKDGVYPDDLVDPNQHQTWYKLDPPDLWIAENRVHARVKFGNQLGDQQVWNVREPSYLVVPASKNGSAGPGACTAGIARSCAKHSDCDTSTGAGDGFCGELRHYLCYKAAVGPFVPPRKHITVQDQFSGLSPAPFLPTIQDGGNGIADTEAAPDDYQMVPVGNAVNPGDVIVHPDGNGVLDTIPAGDDQVVDIYPGDNVTLGGKVYWCNPVEKRVAGVPVIQEPLSGGNGLADTLAWGDDVQVVPVGQPVNPGDVIIGPGLNGVIDSALVPDDVVGVAQDVYPIQQPQEQQEIAHQACYEINPQAVHDYDPPLTVDTRDQLIQQDDVRIWRNKLLCVPSEKQEWRVPTMGRWGFAALVAVLMLATALFVGYRRRALTAGSAG